MPVRDGGARPLSPERPAARPGHGGGGPGLVDEGKVSRVEAGLAL